MAATLTIRLSAEDRDVLEAAARRRGMGLSAFVRELAEAQARRLANGEIRAEGERVVAYLAEHQEARDELELFGAPELP